MNQKSKSTHAANDKRFEDFVTECVMWLIFLGLGALLWCVWPN